MTIYGSGSIRFNGLGSDTDFDDMIGKLYKVESRKVTQLVRWRNDWQARLDGFREVRSALTSLQSALLRLNTMDKFMAKTSVSSNDRVATAVAGANSLDATYNVRVGNLAKAYTWSQHTGLHNRSDVITTSPPPAGGSVFQYTYKGTTRTINVPQGTTAEGLVRLINNDSHNPGARAQLIQAGDGITFQMFGMDTGRSNTLVINRTDGLRLNTASEPSPYDEGVNWAQLRNGFDPAKAPEGDPRNININPGTESKTFKYTLDGQIFTVAVPAGQTLGYLLNEIEKRTPGLASLEAKADGLSYFTLRKPDTNYEFIGDSRFKDILDLRLGSSQASINDGPDYTVSFAIHVAGDSNANPITKEILVTQGMTLDGFRRALQSAVGSYGTVSLQRTGAGDDERWFVDVRSNPTIHRVTVEDGTLEDFTNRIPLDRHWDVMLGENARLKVNGWPGGDDPNIWFESATNSIAAGTIVEGISFRLLQAGDTVITTGTDTPKIKQNIEDFVDAINAFRTALRKLTEVSETKRTFDPRFAESQFEMQKGNVLTGNYGIQTIESRLKMAVAGAAIGFLPRQYGMGGMFLNGDIFSSLSQIGITTNADQGGALFGLLQINDLSGFLGSKSLDEALSEDPLAVARLFAANNEGFTDSSNFGYNSQIATVTRAGNYSVRYTVDEYGKIAGAWINGEAANIDHNNFQITSVSGPSRGLVLDIYPHSLVPGTEVKGTVSLREGKVNELLGMLDGSEGMLGRSGTLSNLERNYQEIIDNIEKKILTEDERLIRWERSMINRFARLDAVLARYNAMNEGLQAQITQLNSLNNSRR